MAILMPPPHNRNNNENNDHNDNDGSSSPLRERQSCLLNTFGNNCESKRFFDSDERPMETVVLATSPTRFIADSAMFSPRISRLRGGEWACKAAMWLFVAMTAWRVFYPQPLPAAETQLLVRQGCARIVPSNGRLWTDEWFRMPVVALADSTSSSSAPQTPTFHPNNNKMRSCQDRLKPTFLSSTSPLSQRTNDNEHDDANAPSFTPALPQDNDEEEGEAFVIKTNEQAKYSSESGTIATPSNNFAWTLVCNFLLTTSLLALSHCYYHRPVLVASLFSLAMFKSTCSSNTPEETRYSKENTDASTTTTTTVTTSMACCCCCSPFLLESPTSSPTSSRPTPPSQGTPTMRLKDFLKQSSQHVLDGDEVTEPIADLFPQTTVMFADIAGFTAWSSEREPAQVFMLLESLYRAFDDVANELGVFKLDTIGDCYMAVAGFPDPIEDHGMVMVRFALECRKRMIEVTRNLEVLLGPDTADLAMRFGIHSGPVTAGVLRGKHARFQLLGDTVNLAARMEYTGTRDCIQLSQDTADFLMVAGKSDWITPRDDAITIKGRGKMQTYWLNDNVDAASTQEHHHHHHLLAPHQRRRRTPPELHFTREDSFHVDEIVESATVSSSSNSKTTILSDESQRWGGVWDESIRSGQYSRTAMLSEESQRWGEASLDHINFITVSNKDFVAHSDREQRLIDWITKVLLRHLKKVVAQRAAQDAMAALSHQSAHGSSPTGNYTGDDETLLARSDVFSEVAEIITLPRFDTRMRGRLDADKVEIPALVQTQLREYVMRIASMYRDNPFHSFEHASHVTMSVNKLLKRIVSPDHVSFGPLPEYSTASNEAWEMECELHDSTFGIASDSLTQFAVVFAALIHDVDHQGVPNAQLVKEKSRVSVVYHGKSVAEQNSVDMAWTILLEPCFNELRSCIYATEAERKRFRQLVVNCVLATDIVDEELQSLRKRRWDKAFDKEAEVPAIPHRMIQGRRGSGLNNVDRKATIVIEHIIQASDVAHTMQHWHIYVKWNERLFQEMYGAYLGGRADKDPSDGWYQGELAFFDNYIIPLARKLKECGVFGVSGEEYLNYALENRMEWKRKGQGMCKEWRDKFVHNIQE